jgi:putative DNA primase/helicase
MIDLDTGLERPTVREDYCTKEMGTHLDAQMETPLWDAFLHRVTGENVSLQQYLQRICGYCLTGLTSEHALFFLWGTGPMARRCSSRP